MSHDGSIELFWGEGATRFRLAIGQLLALEEKFDTGCAALLERFRSGEWRLAEAREILRVGLIGGGATMEAANTLIDRWFDRMGVPPLQHMPFAMAVLIAGLTGPAGDDGDGSGEAAAETTTTKASASSPPRSTAPAPSSAGARPKSTPRASGRSRRRSKAGTKRKPETPADSPTR